jgi:hypothetical protein
MLDQIVIDESPDRRCQGLPPVGERRLDLPPGGRPITAQQRAK